MVDLVIRNATIIDGTGAAGRVGDVAVDAGRITAVGNVEASGEVEIDATGKVIAPGFIDPHTHYDAQLFWDPAASPSNLHGVTTIVAGNCGFSLAPLVPDDADYLMRMMAKVEGMPLAALEDGLSWDWESFGDYLSRLEGNLGVNAGFLVGHCALRRTVMGADAIGKAAEAEEVEAMVGLLRRSIDEGGLGFSTSLSYTHNDGDGEPVPSRWASEQEVLALCEVVSDYEGTTLEFVTDGCMKGFEAAEVELMKRMSLAGQRPLNWNVLTVDAAEPERYRQQLEASEAAAAAGARVVALSMPVLVGMNMSFGTYCALNMLPGSWGGVLSLPLPERIAALADPEVVGTLAEDAKSPEAGVFSRLTGWGRYEIGDTFAAENAGLSGRMVADIAAERGADEFATLVEIVVADDLRTVLWPGPTDDDEASWALRAEAWENEHVLIGGSDAGAHLDRMCGAPYTTAFLGDCIRGRRLVGLERAIQLLTEAPAQLFGLRERGQIETGFHADLVLFDPETVDAGPIELVSDLPGGTSRLYSEAVGVERVIVAGVSIVENGSMTAARPGQIIRPGADTYTVSVPGG